MNRTNARNTQLQRVALALLAGAEVSPAVAMGWGILRLSSLIYRLRGRGWPIQTDQDHQNGMARYSVPKGWQPPRPIGNQPAPPWEPSPAPRAP